MLEALGLIEVIGLVGAIEAADTASKAADVKVIGYEVTKGAGMVVVKMVGGVSAVKSAVDATVASVEKITRVVSKHVIARPSDELNKILKIEKEQCDKKVEEEIIEEVIENKTDVEVLEEIQEIEIVKENKKHKNKK